jgi:hypothetical protein
VVVVSKYSYIDFDFVLVKTIYRTGGYMSNPIKCYVKTEVYRNPYKRVLRMVIVQSSESTLRYFDQTGTVESIELIDPGGDEEPAVPNQIGYIMELKDPSLEEDPDPAFIGVKFGGDKETVWLRMSQVKNERLAKDEAKLPEKPPNGRPPYPRYVH